jgi:hypothetical protein
MMGDMLTPSTRAGLLFVLFGGCATHNGGGVGLTLDFDASVADTELARVARLAFSASGDEVGTYELDLGRAVGREERLVYRPLGSSRQLSLAVVAYTVDGVALAQGSTGVTFNPSETVEATLTLSASPAPMDASAAVDLTGIAPGPLLGLRLVRASTLQPIAGFDPLADGAVIPLASVPASDLSIVAITSSNAVTVSFDLDAGLYAHTENNAPYTMCGDNTSTATACVNLNGAGTHTLTVTAYQPREGGVGGVLGALTRSFTLK